jgi:uncharacterized protein HemX
LSMLVIIVAVALIAGALAFVSIQKSHAQLKVIQSEQQIELNQLNDCRNNATCTNIGSISFMITSHTKNDTNVNFDARHERPIKNDPQQNTTPFILPFP